MIYIFFYGVERVMESRWLEKLSARWEEDLHPEKKRFDRCLCVAGDAVKMVKTFTSAVWWTWQDIRAIYVDGEPKESFDHHGFFHHKHDV